YVFTSPVGHFQPNAFGLYDTDGNVLTWTEDCGKKDYYGAPTDGSAWVWDGCGPRVVRGASFIDPPANFRSAGRRGRPPAARGTFVGLRVAQDL
ncbi:MAG: SUMF1/EgtB/PvdO family nonheme iron enzyme, partial [Proteobacteria bacterium]|nr:SUMF1/EgtB/PvdO family nonheme iron enzyme [Pseudomonadota bacterium]